MHDSSFRANVAPGAVLAASQWAKDLAGELRLRARDAYRIDLVLTELVQNVVDHADAADASLVEIRAHADRGRLSLTVIDFGKPFDPLAAARPRQPSDIESAPLGGLGIVLVREFADECRYERRGDANRFEVVFDVSSESAAPVKA